MRLYFLFQVGSFLQRGRRGYFKPTMIIYDGSLSALKCMIQIRMCSLQKQKKAKNVSIKSYEYANYSFP